MHNTQSQHTLTCGDVILYFAFKYAKHSLNVHNWDTIMIRRRTILVSIATFAFAGSSISALAGKPQIYTNSSTGIAINGYDPVAYFTAGKPVEGLPKFSTQWRGAKWHFSSEANKAKFIAAPQKYAPQYGGYCAFAVSYGSTATTVPQAWSIVDNKLYLNNSLGVRSRWKTDIPGHIKRANANWPGVLQ